MLHQQGNFDDALPLCKLALHIRRNLFAEGKIGEYDVALSLSTLGHIYHTLGEINEEEKVYKEAFAIYRRVGRKASIAAAYNNLGRVWVEKGNLHNARDYFQNALQLASGVARSVEIESYNRLGRLALQQEYWEEAASQLEKAEALARQAGLFELAKNLLYLAQALDHLEHPSRSPQVLIQEAKRIARQNNYNYLLALAGEIQGDIYLRRKEYLGAFKSYGIFCSHMARSSLEFARSLRKLNDHLLDIPSEYLPGVIDALRQYWLEEGLDEKYPQLPAICKEVSKHMLL